MKVDSTFIDFPLELGFGHARACRPQRPTGGLQQLGLPEGV
jgi:hypothetical protein